MNMKMVWCTKYLKRCFKFSFCAGFLLLSSCVTMKYTVPDSIMGSGSLNEAQLTAFFYCQAPNVEKEKVERLASYYKEESAVEGVNSDVAFAQMCLETGFLQFGGLVTEDMHNFCGLGAVNEENRGVIFSDERIGVRAHIQHLKAYASIEPLQNECVDPRYRYVNPRGKALYIENLSGTWAADALYGEKLENILIRMYDFQRQKN